jgi:acyl-CoA dehydrogenase
VGHDTGPARLIDVARQIGRETVGPAADAVDREARFPHEALAALRNARLMSAYVPADLGGLGCTLSDLVEISEILGEYCASSSMAFAMHQIQIAMFVHHALDAPYFRAFLARVVEKQNLIASMTTEVGTGGDMRRSLCAVVKNGDRFTLEKDTTTMSYGAEADDYLVSCRRTPEAANNDQIMVLVHRHDAVYEKKGTWDTIGLRGTLSLAASLRATGHLDQIMETPFDRSAALTMVPVSHLLWAGVWLGIAKGAFARAHDHVRSLARQSPGTIPPSASRLAEAAATLQSMRSHVHEMVAEYEALRGRPDAGLDVLTGMRYQVRINNLKLACSTQLFGVVHQAFAVCGIQAFRNDGKYALGRYIRDALAAGVMIGNDRIANNNAALLLVLKDD